MQKMKSCGQLETASPGDNERMVSWTSLDRATCCHILAKCLYIKPFGCLSTFYILFYDWLQKEFFKHQTFSDRTCPPPPLHFGPKWIPPTELQPRRIKWVFALLILQLPCELRLKECLCGTNTKTTWDLEWSPTQKPFWRFIVLWNIESVQTFLQQRATQIETADWSVHPIVQTQHTHTQVRVKIQ